MSTSSSESRVDLVPYPEGAVLPPTARDAFEDAIRYMGTLHPRMEVRQLVENMGSYRIVEAVRGMSISPHLNPLELMLTSTLTYCIRERLLQSPIVTIGTIEAVRQEVLEGGVFIGQELPNKPSISLLQ